MGKNPSDCRVPPTRAVGVSGMYLVACSAVLASLLVLLASRLVSSLDQRLAQGWAQGRRRFYRM